MADTVVDKPKKERTPAQLAAFERCREVRAKKVEEREALKKAQKEENKRKKGEVEIREYVSSDDEAETPLSHLEVDVNVDELADKLAHRLLPSIQSRPAPTPAPKARPAPVPKVILRYV